MAETSWSEQENSDALSVFIFVFVLFTLKGHFIKTSFNKGVILVGL